MIDVIGVDMGSYNIKTSEGFACRSVYEVKNKLNVRGKNILEYKGVSYQMEVGSFDTEIVKAEKRDTLPLYLYALARSIRGLTARLKVVVGMPKVQMDNEDNVAKTKSKYTGMFEFKLDNDRYFIHVTDVMIFPECVGAFYTVSDDYSETDVVLVDIGGSTFNIALFENGEFVKADSLPFGTMNLIRDICNKATTLHNRKYSMDDIERYRRRGVIGKTNDKMEYTYDLAEKYINELFSLLTLEFGYKDRELLISGGGSEMFADNIITRVDDAALIDDYLFSNANGFKVVGGVLFG